MGAAAIVGTAAVLNTPAGQRSLSTFTSAAGASLTANFHAASQLAQSVFSKNAEEGQAAAGAKAATATAEEVNKQAEAVLGSGAVTGAKAADLKEHIEGQVKGLAAVKAAGSAMANAKGKEAKAAAIATVKQLTKDLNGHAKDIAQKLNNIRKSQ